MHSPQIFSSPFWLKAINESDADIIHLHWFQNEMISVSDISKIKNPWFGHSMICGDSVVQSTFHMIEGGRKAI